MFKVVVVTEHNTWMVVNQTFSKKKEAKRWAKTFSHRCAIAVVVPTRRLRRLARLRFAS